MHGWKFHCYTSICSIYSSQFELKAKAGDNLSFNYCQKQQLRLKTIKFVPPTFKTHLTCPFLTPFTAIKTAVFLEIVNNTDAFKLNQNFYLMLDSCLNVYRF